MDISAPAVRSWSEVSKASGFMTSTIFAFFKKYLVNGELADDSRHYFRA